MPLQEGQPGVGFGLTLIASAIIMFLSVARPESQVHCGCLRQPSWSNDLLCPWVPRFPGALLAEGP